MSEDRELDLSDVSALSYLTFLSGLLCGSVGWGLTKIAGKVYKHTEPLLSCKSLSPALFMMHLGGTFGSGFLVSCTLLPITQVIGTLAVLLFGAKTIKDYSTHAKEDEIQQKRIINLAMYISRNNLIKSGYSIKELEEIAGTLSTRLEIQGVSKKDMNENSLSDELVNALRVRSLALAKWSIPRPGISKPTLPKRSH